MSASSLPKDFVAPDALQGIPRQQTNPTRWQGEQWDEFVQALKKEGISIREKRFETGVYVTDAGGLAFGLPHGVIVAKSTEKIANLMKIA
ncbi:MAG: hypothetical protein Q9M21_01460, partial [Mariprofundaceae bacterium]|nr:hypothetical protein [Mariprofundaceae bacterium]